MYDNQLHAAVVELVASTTRRLNTHGAELYAGDENGKGGLQLH